MNTCCTNHAAGAGSARLGRIRAAIAWFLPGAGLVLMPKCPACLAAYVTLWTGLGLSFTAATYLRWALLALCAVALLFLIVQRAGRMPAIRRYFKSEIEPCHTKS